MLPNLFKSPSQTQYKALLNLIDSIFDRFYQVNNSYTKDGKGTGIGLALTKELVELYHGEIKVESEPNNKTSFTILLPLGKEHLKEDDIVEKTEAGDQAGDRNKQIISKNWHPVSGLLSAVSGIQSPSPVILIVEDNADLRHYIRDGLNLQYKIIEAENGVDGLSRQPMKSPT